MHLIDKEEQRNKILESNGYNIKEMDYSMFGDEDVDVFAKLVLFDTYSHSIYPQLSEHLKNNKDIVVNAVKCFSNISFIPDCFFQDTDVIKNIIYSRNEKLIPVEHLKKNIINYMFITCARSSLSTDDIQKACDKHLTKESIVKTLLHQNTFYSTCKKEGSHPCIDDIYIPPQFMEDKDILKLLIIAQFKLIKNNENITKEMIVELLESGYILNELPTKFVHDTDFIKQCLPYEHNYYFLDHFNIINVIKNDPQLNLECLAINPNAAYANRYPLFFESFKEMFSKDIKKIHLSSRIVDQDRDKLFDYLTSQEVLYLFENKEQDSHKKYDFSLLYKIYHYYLNPIIDNKFIIEEMAKQDNVLFHYMSEDVTNDNQFMYRLLCNYQLDFDMKKNPIDSLYSKIKHFGSFENYLEMLRLENSLSSHPNNNLATKKMKI